MLPHQLPVVLESTQGLINSHSLQVCAVILKGHPFRDKISPFHVWQYRREGFQMGPLSLHAFELLARPRDSFGAVLLCNNYKIAAFQKQKGNSQFVGNPCKTMIFQVANLYHLVKRKNSDKRNILLPIPCFLREILLKKRNFHFKNHHIYLQYERVLKIFQFHILNITKFG